ncbi:MAG: acyl-CoA dehydrogenase family protein [Bacteroidales bacterium]|nr:acyl-CoA dehydrogenase family protein [Bacteroidales bacterium]
MENKSNLKSGEFLVKEIDKDDVFIPEEFDEEQLMIKQTCIDFLETEVFPNIERIEKAEEGLMPELLKKAAELGLLGIAIPEEYEGFGQSFVTQMLSSEVIGAGYSFAVAYSAHCGIGTLPIMYYGNPEQRQKYVTQLATGEKLGAYCLTEPGAGSDANSGTTRAVLSEDGKHYILNGQKMWITNAGFADIQIVFAKIENDRVYSAFIVERDFPGVTLNPDERKMGIKGSSTRQIFYNDVKVPVENLLGERGKGYRIALSILHMGRIKLGANVLGAAKKAIHESVVYANERKQFGRLISQFGAIKYKLAEQVVKTFTTESAVYRVSKDIDDAITANMADGCDKGEASIAGISHYAVEAAILKVYGSEALDYVVDESVQIFGGMGYSAETLVEKGYRDSRINRIFEGTNEINRMLVVDTALKRAAKGDYDLFGEAKSLLDKIDSLRVSDVSGLDYYGEKKVYVKNFKKAILISVALASDFFQRKLAEEQEILFNLSDMMMELYVAESTLLRVEKLESMKGSAAVGIYKDILDINIYDAASRILKSGMDALNSFLENGNREKMTNAIDILTKVQGVNVKDARRRIADKLIEDNAYNF